MEIEMRITISGYGGEVTVGSITKEQHVYWALKDDDTDIYAMLQGYPEDCEEEHPEELMLGQFYEMDNIGHANGATFDAAYITVTNDNGDTIWEGDPAELAEKPEGANLVASEDEYYFSETDYEYGIYCYSGEKGSFTEVEVKGVNEFDPSKLRLHIDDVEGNRVISSIEYEGHEVEDTGDYGTSGKSFDFVWLSNVGD
jgi:hypothetical protein